MRRSVHRNSEMLLRHLLRKLEIIRMGRYVGHLPLQLKIGTWKVLLWLNHAHVNILLMGSSNLLLLLL